MFYVKVVDLSTAYQTPFAVCRSGVWFLISEGGVGGPKSPPPPESNLSESARNRVKVIQALVSLYRKATLLISDHLGITVQYT